jgi:TP901 family phage tail tape measure protein
VADVRVRFIGDAASLRAFYAQLGQETRAFGNAVGRDSEKIAKEFFNIGKNTPVQLGKVQTQVDNVNRTFRTMAATTVQWTEKVQRFTTAQQNLWKQWRASGQSIQNFAAGDRGLEDTLTKMEDRGPFSNMTEVNRVMLDQKEIIRGNVDAWESANRAVDGYKQQAVAALPTIRNLVNQAKALGPADPRNVTAANTGQIQNMTQMLNGLSNIYGRIQRTVVNGTVRYRDPETGQFLSPQYVTTLQNTMRQYANIITQLRQQRRQITSELTQQAEALKGVGTGGLSGIETARQARAAARLALPPVPQDFQQMMAADKKGQLLRLLGKSGFGMGQDTAGILNTMYGSNFRVVDDLVRGVTRVSGEFTDAKGRVKEFSAELDKSGNVVTRFGGQLRGLKQFTSQTIRDFQKVVEWTIATTIVFSTLRLTMEGLNIIKEFDTLLQRFGITAQLTTEQARNYFGEFAQIATATATPLKEMLTVADDIALGTRQAGQTTDEWKDKMMELANAVGIYTNLTGQDATQATDILVSSMKQLGIEAEDVIGILNKITAVAGGQAGAIADITQGLAVMAEAGKQAGLSVDEMIATVQVLSQVTAKSPAEVATAFKNLVGSLDNPAALKALEKYDIALKDAGGNLRNIIEIYSEIADKIRKGIIAESDVKALLRAISGGPRRLPDAAALLGNIDSVNETALKSVGATNEALLANEKILGTLQAKWTQLQNSIQKNLFGSFGADFRQLAESGIQFLRVLTDITSQFSSLVTLFIKFAVVALAARAALAGIKFVGTSFGDLAFAFSGGYKAMRNTVNETLRATDAQRGFNNAIRTTSYGALGYAQNLKNATNATSSYISRIVAWGKAAKGALLAAGVAGIAGGLLGGATTGDMAGALGSGLFAGGMGLAMVPSPYFITQIAGIAAMLGGFALTQTTGNDNKEKMRSEETQQALITLIKQYGEASDAYGKAQKDNEELGKTIEELNGKHKLTSDELIRLQDAQNSYTQNILAMADATKILDDTQRQIIDNSGLLGNKFTQVLIKSGKLDPNSLQQLYSQLVSSFLGISGPAPDMPLAAKGLGGLASSGGMIAEFTGGAGKVPLGQSYFEDLTKLKDITKLFTSEGRLQYNIPINAESLLLIDRALQDIKGTIDEDVFANMEMSILEAAAAGSQLYHVLFQIEWVKAALSAKSVTGLIKPEDEARARKILDLMKQYAPQLESNKDVMGRDLGSVGFGGDAVPKGQAMLGEWSRLIQDLWFNPDIDTKEFSARFEQMAKDINESLGEGIRWEDTEYRLKFLANLAKAAGLEGMLAFDGWNRSILVASAELETMQETLDKIKTDFMANIAKRSGELQNRVQGGEFKDNPQEATYLRQQLEGMAGAEETINKLKAALDQLDVTAQSAGISFANFAQAIAGDLAEPLSTIPGLEDAASLSMDGLIDRLFALGDAANLSKQQWVKYLDQISLLPGLLEKISKIRVELKIPVGLSLSGFKAQLEKLLRGLNAASRLPGIGPFMANLASGIQAMLSTVNSVQSEITSWSNTTSSILRSGSGTGSGTGSSGGGGTRRNGKDVSTLDLPEEIANAANRSALIAEAIKRAKALQAKIPGARAEASNDIVELLKGTQRILEVRGVKDDLLRKALEELADIERKRLEQQMKVDQISRIRVSGGGFALLASLPTNALGVSLGGPNGPININLNINGQVLTPAQFDQLAAKIAYYIKKEIAS